MHTRSLVAVPCVLTYVPAAHVVQPEQTDALFVVLNEPTPHAAHVRFVVAEPELVTYSPGTQTVRATHAVAALRSWSQLELSHEVFAVVPPGQ
jgi:hypothetical protein